MKLAAVVLLALCLAGCKHFEHVEFEGTVTGDKNGVFVINDHAGHAIYGDNIKDGKFKVPAKVLEVPGYYSMKLTNDSTSKKASDGIFEVYLQDGKYTIKADASKPGDYPEITSSSPIQQELSAYYSIANKLNGDLNRQASQINARINDKASSLLPKDQFVALLNSASAVEAKKRALASKIMNEFVAKYPQNTIGAHLMLQLDYESDPVAFNTIYQKLSATVKSSDDGKEIGEKLGRLVKLIPGAKAPAINGKLLDGKPFDPLAMHKAVYLIDFWRAANDISRRNHVEIKSMLREFGDKDFGVISVSMDTKADWWSSAVKEDGITWTQVSDLKGDDSPNTLNWSVTKIPHYDLVDGNWHMIERDVSIGSIYLTVKQHLSKAR